MSVFRLFTLLLLLALAGCKAPADGVYSLELYAHGDIHGKFFSNSYSGDNDTLPSLEQICGYLNERRGEIGEGRVIAVDLGDHIHGDNSAYYYNNIHNYAPSEKHLYSRIVSYIGYDAIVAGNHDLEAGRKMYEKVKNETGNIYLGANVVDASDGKPYFNPYVLLDKEGVKIAIIGLTTPEVINWVDKEVIGGLEILPIEDTAIRMIEEVKGKFAPHFIFLAVHAGTGDGSNDKISAPCRYLAANIKGIDGVLAAHDHIPYCGKEWNGEDSVVVVNSGAYGKMLQCLELSVEFSSGEIVGKKIEASQIQMQGMPGDIGYRERFRKDYENVKHFSCGTIGEVDEDIVPSEIFDAPCFYSNILHYVQMKESDAQISFVSPTKFQGRIGKGMVTYNDILKLYPFENILYKVSLTGHQIKNYLEISYGNWKSKPVSFDCAGGLRYKVHLGKPYGDRVEIISFTDGSEFDLNSSYSVAMASYRANGGGNLIFDATGLAPTQIEDIVIEKYSPVKVLLYRYFADEKKTAAQVAAVSDWELVY